MRGGEWEQGRKEVKEEWSKERGRRRKEGWGWGVHSYIVSFYAHTFSSFSNFPVFKSSSIFFAIFSPTPFCNERNLHSNVAVHVGGNFL